MPPPSRKRHPHHPPEFELMPYMVERARENAKRAREGLDFAYPLPADRNIEASVAMIDGPQSVVSYEAENRVHGHKAMMAITRS